MPEATLYELAGADPAVRFSPYCWRTRLALAHKRLPVKTVAWHYRQKSVLAFSGQERVPVLVDGDSVVHDSWSIARYLERTYPDRPPLFGGADPGPVRFINTWADTVLHAALSRLAVLDIYAVIDPEDRPYFRDSREQRYGATLEDYSADRPRHLAALEVALAPVAALLSGQPCLAGEAPAYADYVLAGTFQWIRCIGGPALAVAGSAIERWWRARLDDFDGLLLKAPVARVEDI